ncbi:adapter protein MecA [Bacillus coahuilensis p1.1.43]|uniref:Adapter protein MecA n=1 Tax=Bacillus coahuilensis p1.1.43 TaxID=1150625 RepID=A0A147KA27_9BACI|nr:adaptor protein MecA [Bacillus coahuilensis]KUP07527.1 adapter protein MecA [Bacillus coahuilensis p1.1.43]
MEIERINDNTVKFYISYIDIEDRGFDREEIWYNRERSEELFWDMMDEIHTEEDFNIDGPLWIQVQALDKGLEILVTRAHLSKDGQKFELPIPEDKLKDLPVDDQIEEFLEEHFHLKDSEDEDSALEFVLSFHDFEDVISLSHSSISTELSTTLYSFEDRYYLYLKFDSDELEEEQIDNILSMILEYGHESALTIHRLEEYGKVIVENDVFETVTKYFH